MMCKWDGVLQHERLSKYFNQWGEIRKTDWRYCPARPRGSAEDFWFSDFRRSIPGTHDLWTETQLLFLEMHVHATLQTKQSVGALDMDNSQRDHLPEIVGKKPEELRAISRGTHVGNQKWNESSCSLLCRISKERSPSVNRTPNLLINRFAVFACGSLSSDHKHREHTCRLTRMETDEFKVERCKSESVAFLLAKRERERERERESESERARERERERERERKRERGGGGILALI